MLPAAYRDRVAMISLLGLEPKADWEIRVAGWFGAPLSEKSHHLLHTEYTARAKV